MDEQALIVGVGGCDELVPPTAEERDVFLASLGDLAVHEQALHELAVLRSVAVRQPPPHRQVDLPVPLRVAAWNAERGTHLDAGAAVLTATGADVCLLSELDVGMARTGQRHTARELALRLGCGYAYGVEFVELGLGNALESAEHEGEHNDAGLHGGAVLARCPLRLPAVVRIEDEGAWFTDARPEPRVGGRVAVAVTLPWADDALVAVSVHLESHSTPDERAEQMARLLAFLDTYAAGAPVVIGGDLNTFSASAFDIYRSSWRRAMVEEEPTRFVDPVPHEPLFEVAAAEGYAWTAANAPGPTQRTGPSGHPKPPLMRLDWFLTRGVEASDPVTVPAVDDRGDAISDHDVLAVSVAPTG